MLHRARACGNNEVCAAAGPTSRVVGNLERVKREFSGITLPACGAEPCFRMDLTMKFCTVLILSLAASASAAIFTLNPTEDAFVSSANANLNYGGGGALAVAAAALPNGEFDSLLKFNLAAAKASFDATFGAGLWAIDSIALQLTASPPNNSIFNGNGAGPGGTNVNYAGLFSIKWMLNDSWVEGSGTPAAPGVSGIMFSTLPSFLSAGDETLGTFSFNGATSGNNTWTLALTTAFLADATAGNSLSLLSVPADTAVGYIFNALSATAANRPVLTVSANAVPEPGTSMLLASAAAVWLTRRRRDARAA